MQPRGRTAGGIIGVFALAAAITTAILVVGTGDRASAAELEQFESCAELEAWTSDVVAASRVAEERAVAEDLATTADAAGGGEAASAADDGAGAGGTNTVVAGVDEIDIVDRVGDDRLVVARNGALSLVDLTRRVVVDELVGVPWDARVSVDGTMIWVAGSSRDWVGTDIRRVRVEGDAFVADGQWSTSGWLLDARRTGDLLHVVTVEHPEAGAIPFEDGPVACDQVWRPAGDATTPAATLVASLPSTGELTPVAAAEVTGAAGNILVTDTSVYIATETWSDDPAGGNITTGLHRFDLSTLAPTGSGAVPGTVAGPFALNEHAGHLRVATSLASIRAAIADDVATLGEDGAVIAREPAPAAPQSPTQTPEALAEVFVLDTGGDLDIVGRSGLFGHDGETIHGVRFLGDVAYVVTFLQTDPFWVIDLADPAAPTIVGELEITGFSAYLHPAGDGLVVGFGPDGSGNVTARLFDVSDPSAPAVVDEARLGNESPIVWDHHAYVGLDGGRFAVPVTDWPEYIGERCEPGETPGLDPDVEERGGPIPVDPGIGDGTGDVAEPFEPGQVCEPITRGGATGASVLGVDGGRLTSPQRAVIDSDGSFYAERIVLASDGTWLLVGSDRIVPADGGEPIVLAADESERGVVTD